MVDELDGDIDIEWPTKLIIKISTYETDMY
jgi:hypothetical protein